MSPHPGVNGRDLVIAMTRDHLYEVVAQRTDAFARTFTLHELARRLDATGVVDTASLAGLVAAVSAHRSPADVIADAELDLADPYGGPARGHARMVGNVDQLTGRISLAITSAVTSGSGSSGSGSTFRPEQSW